jgi:hypothetical protein
LEGKTTMENLPTSALIASTAVATIAFLTLAKWALYPRRRSIIPNPLKTTIPYLTQAEVEGLDYRPGMFSGARDVDTPVSLGLGFAWLSSGGW